MKFWTLHRVREGFERFKKEHGRLPTALEIDKIDYLPSSRLIQNKFGGLVKLRGRFGYHDTHFGKGSFRSTIAIRVSSRGRAEELALEKILHAHFGEVFVHTEKIFDTSKNRVDFYIYSPDGNFGVDVFYTETMQYLQSNINIKMNKYHNFPTRLFLVVANTSFNQAELDRYAAAKIKPLPQTTKLVTKETLLAVIQTMKAYSDPLK